MKNFAPFLIFLLIVGINSCSKKDDCDNPVDCLPPATQTGEGTIGCLVNGEVFKPGGSQLGGPTQQVFYQFVDGEYHFGLSASKKNGSLRYINISLNNEILKSGRTFQLANPLTDGKNFVSNFGEFYTGNTIIYSTNNKYSGEVEFTKYENGIVSGTFWFDAVNDTGEVVEIREGRFDMKYN